MNKENKIDKRKLKTRRTIVHVDINDRNNTLTVEMGGGITDVDVFESIVHIINTLAERLDADPQIVWKTLLTAFNDGGMKK